jgi:hypothetical protein
MRIVVVALGFMLLASTARAQVVTASPDGTVVPPAAAITDSAGGVFMVRNGTLYRGFTATASGTELRMVNGTVYAFQTDGNWYRWNGVGWTWIGANPPVQGASVPPPSTPPSPPTPSAAAPKDITWDHDGLRTTSYQVCIDTVPGSTVGGDCIDRECSRHRTRRRSPR